MILSRRRDTLCISMLTKCHTGVIVCVILSRRRDLALTETHITWFTFSFFLSLPPFFFFLQAEDPLKWPSNPHWNHSTLLQGKFPSACVGLVHVWPFANEFVISGFALPIWPIGGFLHITTHIDLCLYVRPYFLVWEIFASIFCCSFLS